MDSLQQRWQQYAKQQDEQEQHQKDTAEANQQLCEVFWNWAQQPANRPHMPLSTYNAETAIRGVKLGLNLSRRRRLHVGRVTKQGRTVKTRLPGSLDVVYHDLFYMADGTLTDRTGKEVEFHLLDPTTTFALIRSLCEKHSLSEPTFP